MAEKKKKPTAAAPAPVEPSSRRTRRPPNVGIVQNFHLVWLDGNIDEANDADCRNSITKLQQVVNTVNTFTDADECIDKITDHMAEKTFMIVSATFSEIIIPIAHDIPQVVSIYIFCGNEDRHEQWVKQWPKVKGVFTDITPICEALKQATQDCDQNLVSISFVKTTDGLDSSFMYTQILKEILLTIDFEPVHFKEFLMYCREQLAGNTAELKNVDKLGKDYRRHLSVWWYTYNCFLYSMLNRALRTMEVELIIKMGFFVRDLHEHLTALHKEQFGGHDHFTSFTVYRGQGLSQTDFDQIKKTQGGLLSFNNFLSTSNDRDVSLKFARRTTATTDLMGVLFVMKIDPSIPSTPFANIRDFSAYQKEEEILFSMHSVFRIGQMKQIDENDRLWQVDLFLTSDNDPDLCALTESMREETFPQLEGWERLCNLLNNLGQSNKAQQVCEVLLDQASNQSEEASIYHLLGMVKINQGEYAEAIVIYEKSIKIQEKIHSPTDLDLATSYNNIGLVYDNMGDYSKALSYYEQALEIYQKTLPPTHPNLATSYNNIGSVYWKMNENSKALSYYEKALEIRNKSLPPNHPNLAASYNNIGLVYHNMGDYSKALSYYEKALGIGQKTLPPNHPHLTSSYNNIGSVCWKMNENSKALSYYEKALEIRKKSLPPNHPHLATSYNNIGSVYSKMGDYSKALSSYEKALEICQKSLPPNHPDLATSYDNIAMVYFKMGDYSKALSPYEKALEICQKSLRLNHPHLATSYDNIGMVYFMMGDYSKALSSLEKALEICQKSLLPNHPDLAASYSNIAGVYLEIGDYSKALPFCERAVEIGQRSLPANHPNLQLWKENLEIVKKKLTDFFDWLKK
jgi:tetratricopeptide (TPR) repeat protein